MMILFLGRCTERLWGDVNVSDILQNVDKTIRNHMVQRPQNTTDISDQQVFRISNKNKRETVYR
jgi:hypothetical protein